MYAQMYGVPIVRMYHSCTECPYIRMSQCTIGLRTVRSVCIQYVHTIFIIYLYRIILAQYHSVYTHIRELFAMAVHSHAAGVVCICATAINITV